MHRKVERWIVIAAVLWAIAMIVVAAVGLLAHPNPAGVIGSLLDADADEVNHAGLPNPRI